MKRGPRNVEDVPWATGKCFFLTHFIFILLTKLFRYYFKLLATMTMMSTRTRTRQDDKDEGNMMGTTDNSGDKETMNARG